jgi:hypothetical protein
MKRDLYLPILILMTFLLLPSLWGCAARRAHPGYDRPGYGRSDMGPTRIVVLPFYTEEGRDARDAGMQTLHYRRMMRFINNALARHGFEVINPFAREASEREYNRVMERAREDSPLACLEMCKKYGTDVAYIVWLHVRLEGDRGGLCKARARVDGEGYDSAGRDLGAGVSKTFKLSSRYCDDAIADVEKEIGDLVGMRLTAWQGRSHRDRISSSHGGGGGEGGVLQRRADALSSLIDVRLDGANEYELSEVFGKVINTATGVVEAKRYSSQLIPDNPQASWTLWRVRIDNTDPFRLQANIMHMINRILDAGGQIYLRGVHYRYSAAEVDMLMGIRPGDATSRSVQFVIDRERARDRRFEGLHDPYKARERRFPNSSPGFE